MDANGRQCNWLRSASSFIPRLSAAHPLSHANNWLRFPFVFIRVHSRPKLLPKIGFEPKNQAPPQSASFLHSCPFVAQTFFPKLASNRKTSPTAIGFVFTFRAYASIRGPNLFPGVEPKATPRHKLGSLYIPYMRVHLRPHPAVLQLRLCVSASSTAWQSSPWRSPSPW